MFSPTIRYPAAGTFSISILPRAPTKRISFLALVFFKAFAMAMAGKICPPVPPPLITTRISGFGELTFPLPFLLFNFPAYTQDDSQRQAGKQGGCSSHAYQRQRLP